MAETLKEVFDDIYANCDVLLCSIQKIKEPDSSAPIEQDLQDFQATLAAAAKVLSHEATKFAIAHSSPPFPEASTTQNLAGSLCNAASQLVGCYLLLPCSVGTTFLQTIARELESLIQSLKQFVQAIQNIILKNETMQSCLLSTGILWEFCDKLPTLPKNNVEAVSRALRREERLITDAVDELEQNCRNVGVEPDSDDDSDEETLIHGVAVELLPSVRGLVKTAMALVKRTAKMVKNFEGADQSKLDPIVEAVTPLSSLIDDLICSLYSPVNVAQAVEHGCTLSTNIRHLLDVVRIFAAEGDQKWIQMVTTAVEHNLQNLQSKAGSA